MDTQTIRQGLFNLKSRSTIMDSIIGTGVSLAPAVIPLLQDRDEGVRWAAIKILTEIGNEDAVPPLAHLLEQSKNVYEACLALETITGQKLGNKPEAWKKWITQLKLKNGGALEAGLSNEDLMAAAIKDLPVTMTGSGQEFIINVPLPNRRSQIIQIDFSIQDHDGHPVVQLTTPCGPAQASQYEEVLKLNMSITYGAIGLALLDDTLFFALVQAHLRATVHPEDIAKSIMSLANHGDALERTLSATDKF